MRSPSMLHLPPSTTGTCVFLLNPSQNHKLFRTGSDPYSLSNTQHLRVPGLQEGLSGELTLLNEEVSGEEVGLSLRPIPSLDKIGSALSYT